jgi:hypothetical protein
LCETGNDAAASSDTQPLSPSGRTNNAVGSTLHESTQRNASPWMGIERDDASPPIVVHMMAAGAIALIRPAIPRRPASDDARWFVPHTESSMVAAQRKSIPCLRFGPHLHSYSSYRQGAPASRTRIGGHWCRSSMLLYRNEGRRSCASLYTADRPGKLLPTPLREAIIIPMRLGQE